jgi:tartrate-resistant acid phosphatase type 5
MTIKINSKWFLLGFGLFLPIFCVICVYAYVEFNEISRIPNDIDKTAHLFLLAVGDQGNGSFAQHLVSYGMERAAEKQGNLDFMMSLGDNFYMKGVISEDSTQWKTDFKDVYTGEMLETVPFYSIFGNHDARGKPVAELNYASKHLGSNRWRMPAHYYSQDYGLVNHQPLLRVVYLDTTLAESELIKEADFISKTFSDDAKKPIWRVVVGHYPVITYGKYKNKDHANSLINMSKFILPALKTAKVDFYLAGHDHNQQVIEKNGEPFYFINGGGGATLYPVSKSTEGDLIYSKSANGFMGASINKDSFKIAQYNKFGTAEVAYQVNRTCQANHT